MLTASKSRLCVTEKCTAKLMERVRARYGVQSMVVRSDLKEIELYVSDGDVISAQDKSTEQ